MGRCVPTVSAVRDDYVGLLAAAMAAMGSPGPATVGATATAAAFGLRRALPYLLGSTAGTVSVLIAVATGLGPLLSGEVGPVPLRRILLSACVVYLFWLSWRIASAPPPALQTADARAPSFMSGVILGVTNPKAYAALAAVVAGHWPAGAASLSGRVLLVSTLAVLALAIHVAWASAGAAASQALRQPRISRAVNVTLALVLAGSSVPLVIDALV